MANKKNNEYIMFENKNKVKELEKFFVDAKLDNIYEIVEQKKNEIVEQLTDFNEKHIQVVYDKYGNPSKIANPYLISTYFFKSINPLASKSPEYSAEKLCIVWELYMYLVEQVNMNVAPFQPTLTHFAKFAGISLSTLSNYKNSNDDDMVTLCEKIYDECFNGNVSMAQNGMLKEKSTITRMKIENQAVETTQPQIKVNVETKVDLDEINKRLVEIKGFNNKMIELDKKRK